MHASEYLKKHLFGSTDVMALMTAALDADLEFQNLLKPLVEYVASLSKLVDFGCSSGYSTHYLAIKLDALHAYAVHAFLNFHNCNFNDYWPCIFPLIIRDLSVDALSILLHQDRAFCCSDSLRQCFVGMLENISKSHIYPVDQVDEADVSLLVSLVCSLGDSSSESSNPRVRPQSLTNYNEILKELELGLNPNLHPNPNLNPNLNRDPNIHCTLKIMRQNDPLEGQLFIGAMSKKLFRAVQKALDTSILLDFMRYTCIPTLPTYDLRGECGESISDFRSEFRTFKTLGAIAFLCIRMNVPLGDEILQRILEDMKCSQEELLGIITLWGIFKFIWTNASRKNDTLIRSLIEQLDKCADKFLRFVVCNLPEYPIPRKFSFQWKSGSIPDSYSLLHDIFTSVSRVTAKNIIMKNIENIENIENIDNTRAVGYAKFNPLPYDGFYKGVSKYA